MPRGGRRTGTVGSLYPNRTDMRAPIAAAPGQPYGEAGAQLAAQHAVPMGAPPPPAAAAPPPGGPTPPPQPQPILPGQLPAFNRPSEQPDVHVMSGAPTGPGPGLEALGLGAGGTGPSLADTLSRVATAAGSPELNFLAQRARNLGQ